MRRPISLLALVCLAVSGVFAAQTTVSDNVNTAIGALYGGTVSYVTISWPAFTGADSTAVAAGSTTLTISGGVLSVALTPNYGTGTSYAVWYQAPGGITYRDNWAVPVSGGSVALSACRPTGTLLIGSNATSYVLPGVAPSGGSSSLPSGSGLVKVTSGIGSLASAGADYDPGGAAAAITLSGLSPAMTVGAGGVTANHVIQLSAGQAIAGNGGYGGIAQSTAAAAGSVPVSVSAGITQSCVFETAAVVDDVAIPGTTDKTTCRDSGVTATSAVPNSTTIIGKITSAASIGGTATVRLHGLGVFGTQVQTTSLGSVQGNGAKVQLSTGTTTTNDCVKFDANGNTIDAGAACGSGGGGGITALTGDLTASGTGSVAGTLATVNSNVGTFSGLTVNGKGLVTAAANPTTGALVGTSDAQTLSNKTISGATNTITNLPTGALATVQGNGTKVQLSTGTTTSGHCVQYDASGNVIDAGAACGTGGGSGITALTGDLTASGTGSVAGTLATVNSNVGTFNSVTVNGKGLVTAATNGLYPSIVAKTSFYTLLTTDVTATCDATGGAFTLTLPAAPASNQIVFLKKIDSSANTCTVSGNSKTIDGATSVVLASQYQGVALHYNGTNWVRFSDALLDSNLKIPHSTLPTLIQADIPSSITTPLATRIGTGWNFCFAGDSRTAGAGTTTPATQAWPAVLGTLSSLNTRGTVINTSVSGSTISTAQTSPPSLITVYSTVAVPQGTTYGGCQQYSPRVASGHGMLFIMGGVNDFRLLSHTGAQAITDLTTLVTSAQSDSWDRIFVLTNYQHSGGITNAGYETAMEQFNAFIRNNSLNVTTIDIAALLPNPYDQNLFNSDALHANILGNSVIAQKVNSQVWTDGETTVNPIREVNAVSSITGASNQSFYPGCFSALTTGFGDTCAGKLKTGTALTTAQKTTLYGAGLAPVATTGNFATLFGYGSGNLLTTGSSLVFMGVQGFNGVTTASDNIGMGVITCQSQTGGTLVCIGDNTGGGGALTNSVLVGHNTAGNITGSANIMIGNSVANVTASISNSVLIGTSAGVGATGGAGLTFVGHSTGGAGLGGPTIAGGFGYQANASANGAYEIGQGLNSTANSLAFVGNVFVDSNGSLHDKGFIANINPQTASYTLLNTDSVVTFDTTSGAMTATLPVSPAYIGQRVTIMNIGSNTLSISPSPHFLNGATSSITIPTQYGSQTVTYTATNNWVTPIAASGGSVTLAGAVVGASGSTTLRDYTSVVDSGAKADAIMRADGAMTNGSATLTSASGSFTAGDVGKYIEVIGAGSGGYSHADGAMTSASKTLTSAAGTFAASDVGRHIYIPGAGAAGANLYTQIATYNSATSVTVTTAASTTVTAKTYWVGGMTLEGTISAYTSATQVTLSVNAAATITSAKYVYGTNNSSYFQTALDALGAAGGGLLHVPDPVTCPATATACGYIVAATDMQAGHNPSGMKIRYSNIALVGDQPQTNIFVRGAWKTYVNPTSQGSAGTYTIRGYGLVVGDIDGANGAGGAAPSNVSVQNLHFYGMTDGATYSDAFSANTAPLTTTGDGWDTTHKGILLPTNTSTQINNILIDNCVFEAFKGEQIFAGGSPLYGVKIQNSTMKNSNGDGISMLAADLVVKGNTFDTISHGAMENSTEGASVGYNLVRHVYRENTVKNMPKEGFTVVGVDSGAAAGEIEIKDNLFDTIGQGVFAGGLQAALKIGYQVSSVAPGNATITGNFCHDCEEFLVLQSGPNVRIANNTTVSDVYPIAYFLDVYTAPTVKNVVVENNRGYVTAAGITAGNYLYSPYLLNNGSIGSAQENWSHFVIQNNTWDIPTGSATAPARFVTTDGTGIAVLAGKNVIWRNEFCLGCAGSSADLGQVDLTSATTIEPVGPTLYAVNNSSLKNVTVDASKEEDGSEFTLVNTGTASLTMTSDSNMSLVSTITIPVNGSATLRYDAKVAKFVLGKTAAVTVPAGTATALAATPTLCSTGQAPTGILASGNATGCAVIGSGSGITALTGDLTASGTGSVAGTLATVNSNTGACGDSTHVGQVTLDAKGRATACTAVAISASNGAGVTFIENTAANLGADITTNCGSGCTVIVPSGMVSTLSGVNVLLDNVKIFCQAGSKLTLPANSVNTWMFVVKANHFRMEGCNLSAVGSYDSKLFSVFQNGANLTDIQLINNTFTPDPISALGYTPIEVNMGGSYLVNHLVFTHNTILGNVFIHGYATDIQATENDITPVQTAGGLIYQGTHVTTAGTGYSVGNAITFTGGGCTTLPTAQVYTVSSGGITDWIFTARGTGCTTLPTVASIATGSGGVIGGFALGPGNNSGFAIHADATLPTMTAPSSVTPTGTAGSTTYTYKIATVATIDSTTSIASSATSTTTGNATLSGSNYNVISWARMPNDAGYTYDIYRTAGGATQGKIGTSATTSFNDTGLAGDAATAPASNTGGRFIDGILFNNNVIHNIGQFCTEFQGDKTYPYTQAVTNVVFDGNRCDSTVTGAGAGFSMDTVTHLSLNGNVYNSHNITNLQYPTCLEMVNGFDHNVTGNTFQYCGVSFNKISQVNFTDNSILSNLVTSAGLYLGGSPDGAYNSNMDNITIVGNHITCFGGGSGTAKCVEIHADSSSGTAGYSAKHWKLTSNTINGDGTGSGVKMFNYASDATGIMDDFVWTGNEINNFQFCFDQLNGKNQGHQSFQFTTITNCSGYAMSAPSTGSYYTWVARNNTNATAVGTGTYNGTEFLTANTQILNLASAATVTLGTIAFAFPGGQYTIIACQPASGTAATLAWGGNVTNGGSITSTLGACSGQNFTATSAGKIAAPTTSMFTY